MANKVPWITNRGRVEFHAEKSHDQRKELLSRTAQQQEEDGEQEALEGGSLVFFHKGRWALTGLHSDGMVRKLWNVVVGRPSIQLNHSRLLLRDMEEQQQALQQSLDEDANSHIWAILAVSITSVDNSSAERNGGISRVSGKGLQSSNSNTKRGRSEASTPASLAGFAAVTPTPSEKQPKPSSLPSPNLSSDPPELDPLPPAPSRSASRRRTSRSPARSSSPSHATAEVCAFHAGSPSHVRATYDLYAIRSTLTSHFPSTCRRS